MKIIFSFFLMAFMVSNATFACECAIYGFSNTDKIRISFEDADFVFYGKVVGFIDRQIDGYEQIFGEENPNYLQELTHGNFPTFKVHKTYKKNSKLERTKQIQIYQDWSMCDMIFQKDKNYIVFGYYIEGKLRTSICSPNKIITSKKDLEVFKKFKK